MTRLHALLPLAAALALLMAAQPSLAQWPRAHPRLLLITHTRDLPDGPGILSATIAGVAYSREALGAQPWRDTVSHRVTAVQLTFADLPVAATPAQVLATASSHYAAQASRFAALAAPLLRSLGAGRAVYVVDQSVQIAGEDEARRLVWTLSVDAQGRLVHDAPRLLARAPGLLHVRYVPRRLAHGLPEGWGYPQAGHLAWQRVNLQLQPTGPIEAIDTGGAFDDPTGPFAGPDDPDAGLGCLIDRRARPDCPTGFPDVVGLVDSHAAAWALLDYARTLRPVYDTLPAPDGGVEQVARPAIAVHRRELSRSDCTRGAAYRNAGQVGVLLEAVVDRIHVTPQGRSAPIARIRETSMSPTQAYDHTREVASADPMAMAPFIIDPLAPQGGLLAVDSVPGLHDLSPVDTTGSATPTQLRWQAPVGDLARIDVEVTCPAPDRWIARATIAPWARCLGGSCNSTYYPRELAFTRGRAAVADWAWTAVTYRGQVWEPQRIDYDGADTLIARHLATDSCGSEVALRLSLSTGRASIDPAPPCLPEWSGSE